MALSRHVGRELSFIARDQLSPEGSNCGADTADRVPRIVHFENDSARVLELRLNPTCRAAVGRLLGAQLWGDDQGDGDDCS